MVSYEVLKIGGQQCLLYGRYIDSSVRYFLITLIQTKGNFLVNCLNIYMGSSQGGASKLTRAIKIYV